MSGRPQSRPTIYDVARVAGVSPATVSRTFARPRMVSAETAERIRDVALELGYRANPVRRTAPVVRHDVIAVVVADISNPYYGMVTRGVQDVAVRSDQTLQLMDTLESGQRERRALERTRAADGFLLTSPLGSDEAILMTAKSRPVVLINRVIPGLPSVIIDNVGGSRLAVDHLIDLGHREILYVAGPEDSWVGGVRWRTVLDRATERGTTAHRVGHFRATIDGGLGAAPAVLDLPHAGVVTHNDMMAIGLIRGIRLAGGRVPDTMCVVGFDNIAAGAAVAPPLTSVAAPLREMGATAARLLLDLIEGRADGSEQVVLPSTLVVRESTMRHED